MIRPLPSTPVVPELRVQRRLPCVSARRQRRRALTMAMKVQMFRKRFIADGVREGDLAGKVAANLAAPTDAVNGMF